MANLLGLFARSRTETPGVVIGGMARTLALPSAVPVTSDLQPDTTEAVLDTLGAMLQCWSRHPILLPGEDRADAERVIMDWQRHATLGMPIPGVHAVDGVAGSVQVRDWAAITSLTSDRRRAEAANVGEHLGDLQQVVWDTVASLARVAGDDATTDGAVEQELTLLRSHAQRGDSAAVMRELPAALHAITGALAARQSRAQRERTAMAARVESLGRALSTAEDVARTDPMTGAGNRLRFTEATERAVALMMLSGEPSALITLDIDGLKAINDALGHAAGDIAIGAVAKACWATCTRPTDVLCRLGGDEFAVVMIHTSATSAAALADRLERRLNEIPVQLADGISRTVTASIGVAAALPGEVVAEWIARADKRLYEAKRSSIALA